MSNSSSQQSASSPPTAARPVAYQRNGHLAAASDKAQHQALMQATFDRAEAYARLGDLGHAVEWLDRAARLNGDLPLSYQEKRARWDRAPLRPGLADRR